VFNPDVLMFVRLFSIGKEKGEGRRGEGKGGRDCSDFPDVRRILLVLVKRGGKKKRKWRKEERKGKKKKGGTRGWDHSAVGACA